MKQYMSVKKLLLIAILPALLAITGCNRSMKDVNLNPYLLNDSIAKRDGFNQGADFLTMANWVIPIQENGFQFSEQMIGLPYGRYLPPTNSWQGQSFNTFNPSPQWNNEPFRYAFSNIYPPFFKIQKATNSEGINYAWAKIIRAAAMQRMTDTYGPIPYSKVRFGQLQSSYDSQDSVYHHMIKDLTESATILQNYVVVSDNTRPMERYDNVYAGDFSKWVKFANSLKLRMAMRMVYADAANAQKYAEEAVAAGVMENNDDNAAIKTFAKNPIVIIAGWPELRVSAEIVSYLQGYGDNRLEKYAKQNTYNGTTGYMGIRAGLAGMTNRETVSAKYSVPNIDKDDRLLWMPSAEVAFLRAEGALRGWSMGGTAREFYEKGVRLSFAQWGATDAQATTYLANSIATQANYTDAAGQNTAAAVSNITIKWNESSAFEQKLERIITQKWIAMYPLGAEAWSEYRRTGYPKFFPVVSNLSPDGVNSLRGVKRLVLPKSEYDNNTANTAVAAATLGGPDAQSTPLWWDKKKP